ncbi:histidine ammonia-lyase [Putridiphycobacter roseus]|uniref:Histidine ammonia-lyase n=1 Tax=Putridiphycobacter roseus TaxID=2219161 RepID=A0A2W1NF21_9FLAO|nr:histidine ammonia-lyase [Putridiphycobacter roseus]PZE17703.1 histidine ammonia-lyase [Putridiphycobacter roseus]
MKHIINEDFLSIAELKTIVNSDKKIVLSEVASDKIIKCRTFLNEIAETDEVHYGINTGFGSLCNTVISRDQLSQLQKNLVISHACGLGERVPNEIVKLMLLLKVQGLSYGHSGVQLVTVQRLIDFYNNDIFPVVYQLGSLGASGDLAPLAHLALPLLGEGEVEYQGKVQAAATVLKAFNWEAITLHSKEGLALLNGTQFMSSYGVWNLMQAEKLSALADKIGALSVDAFDGRLNPFNANVNEVRKQAGQIETAKNFRALLQGSEIIAQAKKHVQDPYSFRCIPQVHGATKDAIAYAKTIFEREINAVTDNPTIFPETREIVSAGNFHGQPLAITLDFLAIALAELGNISERRIYKLISGTRGLPAFLVKNPGLNSGFMIPQYAAASVVSQNKQLCTPASVDSIESSNGQEDHVSMGANAATKCYRVVENLKKVLAIELFNSSQAISFRSPLKTSPILEELLQSYRKIVPIVEDDKYMHPEIKKSIIFIENLI